LWKLLLLLVGVAVAVGGVVYLVTYEERRGIIKQNSLRSEIVTATNMLNI
jgi:hypothetical protein